MTRSDLWQSVQAIWNGQNICRAGPKSIAADIAAFVFPRELKGARIVKAAGLDRPMMQEAWFASLSHARRACAKKRPARNTRAIMRAPMVSDFMVDRLIALSEQAGRLRRAG